MVYYYPTNSAKKRVLKMAPHDDNREKVLEVAENGPKMPI
jgi:hypothetical protein